MQLQPCYIEKVVPVHVQVLFEPVKIRVYTMEEILIDACAAFDEDIDKVNSKSRKEEYVTIRQIACYVSKEQTPKRFGAIGRFLNRDRTTAMHHYYTVQNFLAVKDPDFMPKWRLYLQNSKLFTEKDFR